MEVFRGENKEEKVKAQFADNIRVTKNRLTKIPERVMEIDVYPTVLKEGTVPVTRENAESTLPSRTCYLQRQGLAHMSVVFT